MLSRRVGSDGDGMPWLTRSASFGCLLAAAACGGRADSTLLTPDCDDEQACEATGSSDTSSEGPSSRDLTSGASDGVQSGVNPSNANMGSNGAAQAGSCPGAVDVARGYFRESSQRSSMPSFDEQGQVIVPEVPIIPCAGCISKCSRVPAQGCEAQDQCVDRHCDCATTGCEAGIPTGDYCLCAATCMGPAHKACLQSWVDYGRCLATCVGACS